jgi:RNA polymerase sigma-70 factor (ECF subfamily)
MDLPTDEVYAVLAKQNDKEAFGVLVDRYEAKLLRYGKKFLSTRQDIEDLVQDIFVNAYRNIQSFDSSQKFSPWIYRIAHNAFIDGLRKNSRTPFILPDFDTFLAYPVSDDSSEKERNRQEIKLMIDKGLDQISPKYKEVLILYYLEELSYKEIAEIIQVPIGTVSTRVKRAKNELKKIYQSMNISNAG